MYAGVTTAHVRADSLDRMLASWRDAILPAAGRPAGFQGVCLLGDRGTGRSLAITLRATEADARRSRDSDFMRPAPRGRIVAVTLSKKEEAPMARYMAQAAYTAEAITTLIANPQDRARGLGALIERPGGRMETFDYCLGEYDVMVTYSVPDDTGAVAIALAAVAPGHLKDIKTTKLIAPDEFVEASRQAGAGNYQAPSHG